MATNPWLAIDAATPPALSAREHCVGSVADQAEHLIIVSDAGVLLLLEGNPKVRSPAGRLDELHRGRPASLTGEGAGPLARCPKSSSSGVWRPPSQPGFCVRRGNPIPLHARASRVQIEAVIDGPACGLRSATMASVARADGSSGLLGPRDRAPA
jgi:hypothetical protein